MTSESKISPPSTGKGLSKEESRGIDRDESVRAFLLSSISKSNLKPSRERSTDSHASSRPSLTTVTASDSRIGFNDLMRGYSKASQFSHENEGRSTPLFSRSRKRRFSRSPKRYDDRSSKRPHGNGRDSRRSASRSRDSARRSEDRSLLRQEELLTLSSADKVYPANNLVSSSSVVQVAQQVSPVRRRNPHFSDLPLEWWERDDRCKDAKERHTSRIDRICSSREYLVLQTTLWKEETVLEPNMFPYNTPPGVEHFTLWSKHDMKHDEIIEFVDTWLLEHYPHVRRWQYDDNFGERSVLLFHVHVFIEMKPFSFHPRPGQEYFPPHLTCL